ncbi:hypothetical protein, partial [Acidaminococcus fermentans]|uniref:hypothetical protein n=1 Tax=Acidaminococcus fermentans TaxID=905 RepID=UPI003079D9DC
FDGEIKIKTDVSKNRSRPYVVDELELTPIFDKEPIFTGDHRVFSILGYEKGAVACATAPSTDACG